MDKIICMSTIMFLLLVLLLVLLELLSDNNNNKTIVSALILQPSFAFHSPGYRPRRPRSAARPCLDANSLRG